MRVHIEDILECIEKIDEYTREITEDTFYKNTQIQDAVLRRLEIIGEVVKKDIFNLRTQIIDIKKTWKRIIDNHINRH